MSTPTLPRCHPPAAAPRKGSLARPSPPPPPVAMPALAVGTAPPPLRPRRRTLPALLAPLAETPAAAAAAIALSSDSDYDSAASSSTRGGGARRPTWLPPRPALPGLAADPAPAPAPAAAADPALRYRCTKLLGAGAFATVWRAADAVAGGHVAVKVLADAAHHAAGRLEHALVHPLAHPNVVRALACLATPRGELLLVQEYCAGGELFARIEPDVGVPVADARDYMHGVASALECVRGGARPSPLAAAGVLMFPVPPSSPSFPPSGICTRTGWCTGT